MINLIYQTNYDESIVMPDLEPDVANMLSRGEQILFESEQSRLKPGGSSFTPNTIYITNQRIIFRNPRLLGLKKDYIDIYYRDVNQIRLKKGIFSTEIRLLSRFQDKPIVLPAVDKKDAEKIGGFIRQGMEKLLPGQVITEKTSAPRIAETVTAEDPVVQLEKLGRLKDAGILSEEEFKTKKKELLSRI